MNTYGREKIRKEIMTTAKYTTSHTIEKVTELKQMMHTHSETAPNHMGNVVNYTIKSHPFAKTAQCSFCGTHLEVKMDQKERVY